MDQDWYRGEVTEVLSASQVTVYFMDYGNSEKQDMANIRPFKDDYTKRKALGIKCALAGKVIVRMCSKIEHTAYL